VGVQNQPVMTGARITRLLVWCGVIGPPLFVVVAFLEGATRPGYSQWRHYVSDLALSDQGWMQVANFLVFGVLSLAFAVGFRRARGPGAAINATTALLVVFGLGLITAGLFRTDPNLGYPPGAAETHTTHGIVHGLAGLAVFGSITIAPIVMAVKVARDRMRGWAAYSIATGILIPISFVASNTAAVMDATGSWPNAPVGLFQRIAIVAGWAWITLTAIQLLRRTV
jgi:hypothetical membrane protein